MRLEDLEELCQNAFPSPCVYDGMHDEITARDGESWTVILEGHDDRYHKDQFGHGYNVTLDFVASARDAMPIMIKLLSMATKARDIYNDINHKPHSVKEQQALEKKYRATLLQLWKALGTEGL